LTDIFCVAEPFAAFATSFWGPGTFAAAGRTGLFTTADRFASAALAFAALALCNFSLAARSASAAALALMRRSFSAPGLFADLPAERLGCDFLVIPTDDVAAAMILEPDRFAPAAFFEFVFLETCLTRCFLLVFFVDDIPAYSQFAPALETGRAMGRVKRTKPILRGNCRRP
jgi:hypothetical protein